MNLVIGETTFVIKKMPLLKGDRWANRAILALCKAGVDLTGVDLSGDFKGILNLATVADIALRALGGVDDVTAQGLLDELMDNVSIQLPAGGTRPLVIESDVPDIKALWDLRVAAIKVNLDFLTAGVTQ